MTLDVRKIVLIALAGAGVALVLALGFSGWVNHASDLVIAYGYAGLSWCL